MMLSQLGLFEVAVGTSKEMQATRVIELLIKGFRVRG